MKYENLCHVQFNISYDLTSSLDTSSFSTASKTKLCFSTYSVRSTCSSIIMAVGALDIEINTKHK